MSDRIYSEEDIIIDGLQFLRTLTEVYGQDKGMEVWHAMGDAIGAEVQGKIFFAMLTGDIPGSIAFKSDANRVNNAVAVIKCIRQYTGFGLKEAKDKWDESKMKVVRIDCDPKMKREFIRELRDLGCDIMH